MANTHLLIASVSLTGASASIDFSSIPSTYTDLYLLVSSRVSSAGETSPPIQRCELLINNTNTGSLYSINMAYGIGGTSNVASAAGNNGSRSFYCGTAPSSTATASVFSNISYYFPNYAGSTNKVFSIDSTSENNGSNGDTSIVSGLFASTAAINQLTLKPYDASNFVQYSTAYLYGIKNS